MQIYADLCNYMRIYDENLLLLPFILKKSASFQAKLGFDVKLPG